ncbi:MAG: DUF4157 domain-containing protein [Lewinellaceae bacterium]|nr:DUF4157 domain-containing protein [Lewinellaceae bacterium]
MADRVVRQLAGGSPQSAVGGEQRPSPSHPATQPSGHSVQAKCTDCAEKQPLQRKPIFESEGEGLQGKWMDGNARPSVQKAGEGPSEEEPELQAKLTPDNEADSKTNGLAGETSTIDANASVLQQAEGLQEKEEEKQEEEPELQRKPIFESAGGQEEPEVQGCSLPFIQKDPESTAQTESPGLEGRLSDSKGGGSPLPEDTRESMGSAMGADFTGVRVHTDSEAAQMSQDLGAQAFTHGSDIYFNEGKYDPGSSAGQHLLAHELTHTMQQGGVQPKAIQAQPAAKNEAELPTHALDITQRFNPDEKWAAYLAKKRAKVPVKVKIGNQYEGTILVNEKKRPTEATPGKYEIDTTRKKQYLEVKGMAFLNPLREAQIIPVLVLRNFGEDQATKGFLSVNMKGVVLGDINGLIQAFNKSMDEMGFLGLDKFQLKGINIQNEFANGRLLFTVAGLRTVVDGFLEAGVGVGISGDTFTFDLVAKVNIKGLASGDFNLKRNPNGKLEGRGSIQADIANIQANIVVEYLDGIVTIQGTGAINSEKFQGSVSFIVTDKKRADETMRTELGVQQVDQQSESPKQKQPEKKTPKNQVVVGWGKVTATITPWLQGAAMIGIDSEGHVTMVGELTVPSEIELMEKKGKKITLVDFELKAGYGVPLVGQVFIFGGIELFINAGFGPLVLKDIGFKGTYSTDPKILQHFVITGTLGINAFAIIGLEASLGVGITLIGHDIKAGIAATAAAGIKAYAEATPTFEYVEKAAPEGGKVGEAWLKGHFEAAAQLFLMLGGKFFVELDSPWWSPAPSKTWDYPLGSVEYPIGDSMGVGADVNWLVGSPNPPELEFSPVEFNAEKFTQDVMADPPPGSGAGGEKDKKGKWEDQEKGNLEESPEVKKDAEGLKGTKKPVDYTKLPDEQRFTKGLGEVADISDKAKSKPTTLKVLKSKLGRIKKKYALNTVTVDDYDDDSAEILIKHAGHDNKRNLIEVRLMSEAERLALLEKAAIEFRALLESHADEKRTITKADGEAVGLEIAKKHYVVENIAVIDSGNSWDFVVDMGDITKKWPGMAKREAEQMDKSQEDGEQLVLDLRKYKESYEDLNEERHSLFFEGKGEGITLMMASNKIELEEALNRMLSNAQEANDLKSIETINKARGILEKIKERIALLAKKQVSGSSDTQSKKIGFNEQDLSPFGEMLTSLKNVLDDLGMSSETGAVGLYRGIHFYANWDEEYYKNQLEEVKLGEGSYSNAVREIAGRLNNTENPTIEQLEKASIEVKRQIEILKEPPEMPERHPKDTRPVPAEPPKVKLGRKSFDNKFLAFLSRFIDNRKLFKEELRKAEDGIYRGLTFVEIPFISTSKDPLVASQYAMGLKEAIRPPRQRRTERTVGRIFIYIFTTEELQKQGAIDVVAWQKNGKLVFTTHRYQEQEVTFTGNIPGENRVGQIDVEGGQSEKMNGQRAEQLAKTQGIKHGGLIPKEDISL